METNKLHVFEPTDNQGYAMQCTSCGKSISIYRKKEWDQSLIEACPEEKQVSAY
jgi:hypothetical protein